MQIPVNLGDVALFESIPVGTYLGQIDKMVYQEAKEAGKFASVRVTYAVIEDGPELGRKQSEFLSFSPKALWRMKRWFAKFGLADLPTFDVDEATLDILEPDLIGIQVIFKQSMDGERSRTELISVDDDTVDTAPAPAPKLAPKPAAKPAPLARRAPAPAPIEAEAEEEEPAEEEAEEAPAPTPAPRRVAAPAAAVAARPVPQRRTLR